MNKFNDIYNEALGAVAPTTQPAQTQVAKTTIPQPVKLDQGKLTTLMQKWAKAKANNQALTLTPEEMEAFDQLLGGKTESPEDVKPTQQQQTTTTSNKTPTTPAI